MSENITAIIIAAGYSTRMGGVPKALLKVGYESAIERICGTYQACGINRILVVLGDHEDQISPLLDHLKIDWVKNTEPSRGMFSSIHRALESELTKGQSFFIHPVDIPLISIDTIVSILKRKALDEREDSKDLPNSENVSSDDNETTAHTESTDENLFQPMLPSDKFIYAPSMAQRRGHPPLFGKSFRDRFLAMDPAKDNLRDFQNSNLDLTRWVLCDDPLMFTDMDYPKDFEEVNKIALSEKIPSINDCRRLLKEHQKNTRVFAHSEAVLQITKLILGELDGKESGNIPATESTTPVTETTTRKFERTAAVRLECAAILHDIKKGTSFHDREGAAFVRHWGYHQIAALINVHMNYLPLVETRFILPLSPIDETKLSGADLSDSEINRADLSDSKIDGSRIGSTESGNPEADDLKVPLIDERAILFLADKMVKQDKPVSIESKFKGSEEKFRDNPEALEAISKRKMATEIIYSAIFN
jgi:CTP:molybdopterin cytidylyltransferase MocA